MKRSWALKGTVPILLHAQGSWRKLSVISGIALQYRNGTIQTKLFFRIHPNKTIKAGEVIEFLRQIEYQVSGEIDLVWDNLSTHRSAEVKRFLERHHCFNSVHLPPYCPELNPDEGVWNWSKTEDLANISAKDTDEMRRIVHGSLRRFQRRENLHRWCLADSELPWDDLLD